MGSEMCIRDSSRSVPNGRVLRTTKLAKLSFNHPSVVLTGDVFQFFIKNIFMKIEKKKHKQTQNPKRQQQQKHSRRVTPRSQIVRTILECGNGRQRGCLSEESFPFLLCEGYIVSVHRMVMENRPVDPGSIQGSHPPISFISIKQRPRANEFL